MELTEVFKKRRSIRHYTEQSVPRALIGELIEAASMAPVSCNLQLTQYVVIDDQSILSKLSKCVSYKFEYSPCSIVVLHDSRFSIERYSGVMTAGMAIENLLLKATELGLGTCAMAGFDSDKKIKEILSIPDYMEILLIVSVGYIDTSFSMFDIPKLELSKRYKFNNYSDLRTINSASSISKQSIDDITEYRSRISPVYLDRFRLNSYSISYYNDVVTVFSDFVSKKRISKVLDLLSYDAVFLECVSKSKFKDISFTASDYLENNLLFIKKKLGYDGSLIKENIVKTEELFDLVTFIFQFNFTPEVSILLNSANDRLKKDGYLFLAVVYESWYRRLAKSLLNFTMLLRGKKINIYENNPFYKIGPIKRYGNSKIIRIVTESGFKKIDSIKHNKGKGTSIQIYIFKKE